MHFVAFLHKSGLVMNFGGKIRKLFFLIVFLGYLLIGLLKFQCIHFLDVGLNYASNEYPLFILLRRPGLIKIEDTLC